MLLILFVASIVVMICFAYSMYKTLGLIAAEDRLFPIWCAWLMVIPVFGLIFQWLMMPFGLPKSLKAYMPNSEEIKAKSDKLFKLGLAFVIIGTLSLALWLLAVLPMLVLLVFYWLELSKIRELIQPTLSQDEEQAADSADSTE